MNTNYNRSRKHNSIEEKKGKTLSVLNILGGLILVGIILIMALPSAEAFFWQNPVSKYEESVQDYNDWVQERAALEANIKRNDSKNKRDLFYNHCLAIEDKIENGEEIKDARFVKPCEDNNVSLYFEIREGLTTVGQRR